MKLNTNAHTIAFTQEGSATVPARPVEQLRRLVMAHMLWEDQFYVDGKSAADMVIAAIKAVDSGTVAHIAIEAREKMKLRHIPLLLVRELAKRKDVEPGLVRRTLATVIQRPDELTEFLAIYWKDQREPLSAQVKKGLALAIGKFNEYQLAKYNRANKIKLRDVLRLVHPKSKERGELWGKLLKDELTVPDTWEVALSSGADKRETWIRLLTEGKLGALALLRNLRNMQSVNVPDEVIRESLVKMKTERVLPFRFIAAARYAPNLEDVLETAMLRCLEVSEKLPGHTVLLVDVSGSMGGQISGKSEITRLDAACGVAMLLREMCDRVSIASFSERTEEVPPRRGFALRDAIVTSQRHGGTNTRDAVRWANSCSADRIIVITDEQSHNAVESPNAKHGYIVNVGAYQNGIGYDSGWTHISGWSEAVVDYLRTAESV